MADSIRLQEGARLGRYQIVRRLGAGAMGEVYLADDPQIGRRLALKTVRVEEGRVQEIEERKRRLLREARAAGKLLHPNIVTLFDVGEEQGMLYLAFEFVEGTDLAARVSEGPPLSLAEALSIVRQAAEALEAAHRQGVIHRDIKPSNLMLTGDGRVKVADFGIAKVLDQTSDLTMTGSVVGSPHYLSPEQIRGDELDGRTDIFSLGVLFYEILCRKKPFDADTLTTLVYRILNQEPTPIIVRRPDLEPRLERLVQKMLVKDRDQRFATAAEVAAEIAACERELSPERLAGQARPDQGDGGRTTLLPAEPAAEAPPPPPAPPPVPSAAAPPPVPPPMPVAAAPPPAPPALPRTATDSTAFSPPSPPKSRLVGVAVAAVAIFALLVVAGLGARRWAAQRAAEPSVASSPTRTPTQAPSAPPAVESKPSAPAESVTTPAGEAPAPAVVPTPGGSPAGSALEPTAATEPAFQPGERPKPIQPPAAAPAPVTATPAETPRPAPAPVRPQVAAPAPIEAEPETASESEPSAPEPSAAAEDPRAAREALIASLPVAKEMTTGMSLSFEIQPKELAERLVVRFDRIVIGRAAEWNAKRRDGRAYAVNEPGLHIVTFLLDGADVYRIRIDAQPQGASPTVITANLPQLAKRGRRPGGGN